MQAVIMAGGQGSRLRPLTCERPKPLAPICGKPVLEYILDLLVQHSIHQAVVTLRYEGNKIISHFDGKNIPQLELSFSFEKEPLGTAGSVKNAIQGATDDILVISGDAMCDFDLTKAIAFHKNTGAAATLLVKPVDDPREYGLVDTDEDGKILGFIEKPPLSRCTTNLANTGIYILSPKVLEQIPEGRASDFAMDIFPKLLQDGVPIYACSMEGYWCDIGDLKSYLQCHRDLLEGRIRASMPQSHLTPGNYTVQPLCWIGENVSIGEGAVIESGSSIGNNVIIEPRCKIKRSVILDGAHLSSDSQCVDAIIGTGARMGAWSAVYECGVLGDHAVLGSRSVIPDGVKVWSGKQVPDDTKLTGNLQYGLSSGVFCDEDGICGQINVSITPDLCCQIGAAIASLKKGAVIGVSSDGSLSGRALKYSLMSGILSTGSNLWDFGENFDSQFDFCMNKSGADYGIHLSSDHSVRIHLADKGGLPLTRSDERKLEGAVNRGEYRKVSGEAFGNSMDLHALHQLYPVELMKAAKCNLHGISVQIKTSNPKLRHILEHSLSQLGCGLDGELFLHLSSNGRYLSAYQPGVGYIDHDRLLVLLCSDYLSTHSELSVSNEAPAVLESIAEEAHASLFRYQDCSCGQSDEHARAIALDTPFLRDGLMMAVRLLSYLKEKGLTFQEAVEQIPHFATESRFVPDRHPADRIRFLQPHAERSTEGITISDQQGLIRIRPVKSGKGLLLFAEGQNAESAKEICDFFEKIIRENGKEDE